MITYANIWSITRSIIPQYISIKNASRKDQSETCSLMLHLCDMNWPLWHSVFLNCSCNADLFPPNRALKYFKVPSKGPVCVNTGSSCVSPGETAVRVPSWVWSKSQWGETKTDKKADWVKETSQTQQAENNTLIIISVPAVDALELIRRTKPRRGKVCYAGRRRPVKLELNPTVFTGWFQTLWHFFQIHLILWHYLMYSGLVGRVTKQSMTNEVADWFWYSHILHSLSFSDA